jgi:hypothetical protein
VFPRRATRGLWFKRVPFKVSQGHSRLLKAIQAYSRGFRKKIVYFMGGDWPAKPSPSQSSLVQQFFQKKKIVYFFISRPFNVYHACLVLRGSTWCNQFRPIPDPLPHPCLFDVPCSAFNVQIPYSLGGKNNPNQPSHVKKLAKSRPMPAENFPRPLLTLIHRPLCDATLNLKTDAKNPKLSFHVRT